MMTDDRRSTEQPSAPRRGPGQRRNVIIAIVLVAGFALGVGLVLIPDRSVGDAVVAEDAPTGDAAPPSDTVLPPGDPLEVDDLSSAGVAEFAELALPASVADFQTAVTESYSQLDVTFTIPTADEAAFLEGSGLGSPTAERTIMHSSPLWKLNADGDSEIRGVADTTSGVNRAVELVPEGDGVTRVRLVLTPA